MERVASWPGTTSCKRTTTVYVSWEEVFVSTDKGRREVHYLLKRRGGGSDLAVYGKEKSLRHMSYRYAIRNTAFGPYLKLRSRREVVEWLDSVVSGSPLNPSHDSSSGDAITVGKHGYKSEIGAFKDNQLHKMRNCTIEFSWIGLPWTCRKRRKHYQAYKRNGFQISVHDFVFVLAEEDKRLVAYLEDLYEDSKGNKMVVVRWFHKIDEVGIALPHSFSDREVFFSLYLRDLSIECIDGLAFVLSPQHYAKFQTNEACCAHLEPFVCKHQFDNDDVKSFDITHIKGYWKQEILRYLYTLLESKSSGSSGQSDDALELDDNHTSTTSTRPKKRLCLTKDDAKEAADFDRIKLENLSSKYNTEVSTGNNSLKLVGHTNMTTTIKWTNELASQHLVVGSKIEVLSQDSGLRGCWFRASVIKKLKDKVKVQYQDIQDAVDETKKLEEWVLASRIALRDYLCLRMLGRSMVRPAPPSSKQELSWTGDVGSIVDVWWHDGWWEGIVVQKDCEANYHVYLAGEKVVLVFGPGNIRKSHDWVGNKWVNVRARPDLVASIISNDNKSTAAPTRNGTQPGQQSHTCLNSDRYKPRKPEVVPDLLKDDRLSQLRWKITRKRRRESTAALYQKQRCTNSHLRCTNNRRKRSPKHLNSNVPDSFVIPKSLEVDKDDCMYGGDHSIYSSSVVPSLTSSMVMCR